MNILGLAHDVVLSSAALVSNGKVVAAICEERLNRRKSFQGFPEQSINYCLSQGNLALADIDMIAVGWNPARHIVRPNPRRATVAWKAEYLVTVPNQLQQFLQDSDIYNAEQFFDTPEGRTHIVYVDHHMAHLANAFYLSPFSHAALMSLDGVGEVDSGCMAIGDPLGIHVLKRLKYPHSLGLFYGTITSFLGFKLDADEWKVMALAAYGRQRFDNPYYPKLREIIEVQKGGFFELDLTYFNYYLQDEIGFANDKLISVFGEPREPSSVLESRHYDIAAAAQWVFEDMMIHCLKTLHELSGGREEVGLAGGSIMNSVFNGKLESVSPFKRSFVSSCPDDSGVSVGAALAVQATHEPDRIQHYDSEDNYWGPGYSKEEIETTLKMYKIPYQEVPDIERKTAALLAAGNLVGWFQGHMEFGQRALGNRSILADPRQESMKDEINAAVKYREGFRPFAPAVLEECADSYFEIPPGQRVPFMERVFPVKPEYCGALGAVTHVDGSARLQTVSKQTNPRFWKLIEEFGKIVGIPVLLNTSFNLNGEPIVGSPTDAVRTFYSCGLDYLVIGDFMVAKE